MATPEQEQQYRREFEELEAGEAPSHGSAFTPFDRQDDADEFVRYLAQSAGISAEVHRVARLGNQPAFFDIRVKDGKAFEAKLLYRLLERGIRIEDIPRRPLSQRIVLLRDHLHGQATQQGGWHATPASQAQLAWYGEVAQIEPAQVQQAVRDGRMAYLAQQKREGSAALWIAAAAGVIGALILWKGPTLVGGGLVAVAVAFAIFYATRQQS